MSKLELTQKYVNKQESTRKSLRTIIKKFGSHGLLLLLSRFSRVRLCATPQTAATRRPRPWDSPGKNTGVDFLLQCRNVKSESEVAQPCPTLSSGPLIRNTWILL